MTSGRESGCEAAREFVRGWEEGRAEPEPGLSAFKAHLASCASCAATYGPLLPLLERDGGHRPAPSADEAFVARVMTALPEGGAARPRLKGGRAAPRRFLLPAAAAVLALAAGLLLFRAGLFGGRPDEVSIHFSLEAPGASSVVLVGSFSNWEASERLALRRSGAGSWELSVRLKKNELYSYGFLVDGEKWLPDPKAAETIEDGFGGVNSLLRL